MEIGVLLIRFTIGVLFVGHGTRKLFGWFGGGGVAGTAEYFESLGFRHGRFLARLIGAAEAASGVLLVVGFLTPMAATVIAMIMLNAILVGHWDSGLWAVDGGFEYRLVLGVVVVGLAAMGPGPLSVDAALGLQWSGVFWGLASTLAALLSSFFALGTRAAHHPAREV